MQQINLVLGGYSTIISLIIIAYLSTGGRFQKKSNRYFIFMCISNVGMLVGDGLNWSCEGFGHPWFPFLQWCGSFLYFACSAPLLLAFTGYIIEFISPQGKVPPFVWRSAVALTAVQLVGSVVSLFNGMYFTVSAENTYLRGSWFWLSQLIPGLILGIAMVLTLVYRRQLRQVSVGFLLSYVFVPVIVGIVQLFWFGFAPLNSGVTLALLLIFVSIQIDQELRIRQQEKELTESRIDVMLSQIQPHFLYNSLTAIKQLCELDPKRAKDAVQDFSRFLRSNMDSLTDRRLIPLGQELEHVGHYLNLESTRFPQRLRVVYRIEARDFLVPPLSLQPLVENAVRHGIVRKEGGGTVTVHTYEEQEAYVVTIQDDGVGFDKTEPRVGDRVPIGLENVRYRLGTMCAGTLQLESQPGLGTMVTITLPKEGQGS